MQNTENLVYIVLALIVGLRIGWWLRAQRETPPPVPGDRRSQLHVIEPSGGESVRKVRRHRRSA